MSDTAAKGGKKVAKKGEKRAGESRGSHWEYSLKKSGP